MERGTGFTAHLDNRWEWRMVGAEDGGSGGWRKGGDAGAGKKWQVEVIKSGILPYKKLA